MSSDSFDKSTNPSTYTNFTTPFKAREMEAIRRTADPQGLKQRMYDENGHIVGTTNNDGEQVRHNPDMDLSAAGMKLKKAREMEAIRRTANPQGLKQKMYDEIGNLILSVSNDGHRHNLDMDTSAEGMRLKKVSKSYIALTVAKLFSSGTIFISN